MSKQQQLTDWFPGSVKPARPGVYERQMLLDNGQSVPSKNCELRWDGAQWMYRALPSGAWVPAAYQHDNHWCDAFRWRGLASDPNAPAKPAKPKREPREWMRWGCAYRDGRFATFDSRAEARASAVTGREVIRVRVVEVL